MFLQDKNDPNYLWQLVDYYAEIEPEYLDAENHDDEYALWCESMQEFEKYSAPQHSNALMTSLTQAPCFKPHRNPLLENYDDVKAEFLPDSKGNNLLYPGVITLLYGKPGTYKSWMGLSLIGKANVRYWDFENFGPILATRLRHMGIPAQDTGVFDYPASKAEIFARVDEYLLNKIDLLVIDGMSGLARTMGINSDANDQVEKLFNEVLVPLKRVGISILLLDHLPKDSPVDDFPIGAQAKKSQCDVAILLRPRRDSDEVDVYMTKDRNHDLFSRSESGPTPKLYGWLTKPCKENNFRVIVEPNLVASIAGEEIDSFSANLYREIWKFLQDNPDSSGTKVEENVSGKNSRIRSGLTWLVANGFLSQAKKGNATFYRVAKSLEAATAWHARGDYLDF